MTTKEMILALERATEANLQDCHRHGNLIELEPPGDVVMTGDLHGEENNFDRIVRFADLAHHANRHLVIHELLHCTRADAPDQCHSYLLVARAAMLKSQFPDRLHYLLGNHAMAQLTRDEVLKSGKPMVRSLNAGLNAAFGDNSHLITAALDCFILSMPIAVRTANRVWLSHSLPSARHVDDFDDNIFQNKLAAADMRDNPSIHALAWDRKHSGKCLEKLAERWDVDMFVIGHQPQSFGCDRPRPNLIILASDHGHGCILPFDLGKNYNPDQLFARIKPIAEIK